MNKLNQVLSNLKEELSGLLNVILMSERTNSQRCIAKELDTTKTIVDHKDESEEFNQDDLKKIGKEISNLTEDIKGIVDELLISERMNSQRCIAKELDTTKTIVDHKEEVKEFTKDDIKILAEEAKSLANTMLVSERMNSQRCIAKELDTTKTIIDYEDKKEEISKKDLDKIIEDLKGIVSEMLLSERINSQRCIAKELNTTKTIIEHK